MFNIKKNANKYSILWNKTNITPSLYIKSGIHRSRYPLTEQYTSSNSTLFYVNQYIELRGKWDDGQGFGSLLSLKLKNISKGSIRLSRLVFPAENGLNNFLKNFDSDNISFLRNGYQSWSTTRSYRIGDKPLRPWMEIVSRTSGNLSNLPSNIPGDISSEMYSVIADLATNEAFLIGQGPPFNQFFYIRLLISKKMTKKNYFEIVFDFGDKMLQPNQTITLDGILMATGDTLSIQQQYFDYISKAMNIRLLPNNIKGWCTWYYYYNKISPQIIYDNMAVLKQKQVDVDFIQIDDGYQKFVGDWLDLNDAFCNKMKQLADDIKSQGFIPGIWLAPFIADKKSKLVREHPDYVLRTERGKPVVGGYNPQWPGRFYYGLDITNPRFEEYLTNVIKTIVYEWGFKYLKLDFLFGASLPNSYHINFGLSNCEILRYGLSIIKKAAGPDTILVGCGMPLTAAIGLMDVMRVSADTAPNWRKISEDFLHTGAMLGVRNSLRNFIVRSLMHKKLWLNDPDCLMIRTRKTHLSKDERMTHINAIILSGGIFLYSDNLCQLEDELFEQMAFIGRLSDKCFEGTAFPLDMMYAEMPRLYYNTAGFLGVFNFHTPKAKLEIDLAKYAQTRHITQAKDVWTGAAYPIDNHILQLTLAKHQSVLLEVK